MSAPSATTEPQADLRVLPVAVDSLDFRAHDMDLYIWHDHKERPALYRGAGTEFTANDAARLADQGIKFVHIPVSQHAKYRAALAERLERQFHDKETGREERARVIRAACSKMIEDVLLFPGQAEPVAAVREIAMKFSLWARSERDGFTYLLDMSAHDFYTTTHMVNVGVGCGLLMNELRPGDSSIMALAHQGGLLHDLGKRGVPEKILNKEGKLDPAEWDAIKKHPELGYEELSKIADMPPEVLAMTRDHHERLDGKGYPRGIKADQISFPARVCAVVDVYDAITAARPYRGPTPPHVALKMMAEGSGTQFDPDVLSCWSTLVKRMVEADPARAAIPPGVSAATAVSLSAMLPRGAAAVAAEGDDKGSHPNLDDPLGADRAPADASNRRREPRHGCNLTTTGVFLRQMKPREIPDGTPFTLRVLDISRGGAMLCTDWPLAINEVLDLDLPLKGGTVSRRARVVRVRQNDRHEWTAGVQFINAAAAEPKGKAA